MLSVHNVGGALVGVNLHDKITEVDVAFPKIYEGDFFDPEDISCYESEHLKTSLQLDRRDAFYDLLMALETNFNLKEETRL